VLHLITLPQTLFPGRYTVDRVSAEDAARMIRLAADRAQLNSQIHFGSTADVLESLSGRPVEQVDHPRLQPPVNGDVYLHVRLTTGVRRPSHGQIGVLDLDFYRITFEED
jgi:hypothetical protein